MSPSEPTKVRLDVAAPEGTEIFVIDHALNKVAGGAGRVAHDVAPGLYKIRFRAGNASAEVYQEVHPDQDSVEVQAPQLSFSSPAPLTDTALTHEYHQAAAEKLSREAHVARGTGSELFVFVRAGSSGHPGRGLQLCDAEGRALVDLGTEGEADVAAAEPWAGCNVGVDPGVYRLRATGTAWGTLEQVVVASPGFQTQVFLLRKEGDLDPVGATILQAGRGRGFDPAQPAAHLTELARMALLTGRTVVSLESLQAMLGQKDRNPMLAVLAAHALVKRGMTAGLDQVVRNLRGIVGSHPDVEALALRVPDVEAEPEGGVFRMPPMLLHSWSLVAAASTSHPELVPKGSLAARACPHLWGSGAWLVWLADELSDDGDDEGVRRDVVAELASVGTSTWEAIRPDLSYAEEAVVAWVDDIVRKRRRAAETSMTLGPSDDEEKPLVTALAEALQMPPASVESLARSLAAKLPDSPF